MFRQLIVALSDQGWRERSHACRTSQGFNAKMITTHFIEHDHIKWCSSCSLFHKTAYMEARRIRTTMNNLVNGPCITMKGKHDRLISSEVLNECRIVQSMRVHQ